VALLHLTVSFIGESIGESVVCIVPTVVITGLNVLGDSYNLAEQRPTVICGTKQAGDLEPELRIVLEEQCVGTGIGREH
jgi:hypothetical protein